MNWYARANDVASDLACDYFVKKEGRYFIKFPPLVTAGVISALSPNNKWKRNLIDARSVLDAVDSNQPSDVVKVCTYNANKLKAFEIARGNQEILTKSPKTYAPSLRTSENLTRTLSLSTYGTCELVKQEATSAKNCSPP